MLAYLDETFLYIHDRLTNTYRNCVKISRYNVIKWPVFEVQSNTDSVEEQTEHNGYDIYSRFIIRCFQNDVVAFIRLYTLYLLFCNKKRDHCNNDNANDSKR